MRRIRHSFSICFLIIFPFLASAQNDLSSVRLSIEAHQETVSAILRKIELKTKVSFSYNNALFDPAVKKTLVHNGTLEDVLKKLMPADISFIANGGNIILYRDSRKKRSDRDYGEKENIPDLQSAHSEPEPSDQKDRQAESLQMEEKAESETFDEGDSDTGIEPRNHDIHNKELDLLYRDTLTKINPVKHKIERSWIGEDMRRSNEREPEPVKKSIHYSFSPFYQILAEFNRYDDFIPDSKGDFIPEMLSEAEKNILSDRMGVLGTVSFGYLTITSGIGVLNSGESYHYKTLSTADEKDIFIDTARFPIADDTLGFSVRGENRYRYFSFPVLAGYKWDVTEKMIIGGESGIWFNVLASRNGRYVDLESGIPYRITDLRAAPLNKILLRAALDVFVGYRIRDQVYATFSTSYLHPIGSVYTKGYPIHKNKTALAFKIGLTIEW